jgi:hypothetical protein
MPKMHFSFVFLTTQCAAPVSWHPAVHFSSQHVSAPVAFLKHMPLAQFNEQ